MGNASTVGFAFVNDEAIIAPNNMVFATVALCDDLLFGSVLSKPGISMISSCGAKVTRVATEVDPSSVAWAGTGFTVQDNANNRFLNSQDNPIIQALRN